MCHLARVAAWTGTVPVLLSRGSVPTAHLAGINAVTSRRPIERLDDTAFRDSEASAAVRYAIPPPKKRPEPSRPAVGAACTGGECYCGCIDRADDFSMETSAGMSVSLMKRVITVPVAKGLLCRVLP